MFFKKENRYFALIVFYLILTSIIYLKLKDFGIHIEEKFHRMNGLYWLNYISEVFHLDKIQIKTNLKMNEIGDHTLSPVNYYDKWGIIFDVPLALIETIFNINDAKDVYYLKHFFSFLIFLLGSFFFYKILYIRFDNFLLSFFGTLLFVTTPRIFGDSFLYKDVLFLSFFTISLYFLFEVLNKKSIKNIFLFSFLSAATINLRIFGIFLPATLIFILLIIYFKNKDLNEFLKNCLLHIIFLVVLTILLWPYLWSNPIANFLNLFSSLEKDLVNIKIFFNGNYLDNYFLPDTYLPTWIFISSPVIPIIFFIIGITSYAIRFSKRYINIKENTFFDDIWRSKNEQKDFIIFFIFISMFLTFIVLSAPFYNGWRLVYFFNIFILYFCFYQINNFNNFYRKKNIIKKLSTLIIVLAVTYNVISLIIYHPYQSIYFSNLIDTKTKNSFEGDYYGLSVKHFFLKVNSFDKNKNINTGVASHTPIQRGLESLDKNLRKKFTIVGQEYENADYIYKNNISEVNSFLNKKYEVPKNFSKVYELKIRNLIIYEIYKNNRLF